MAEGSVLFAVVALRKESVDRNMGVGTTRDRRGVALRKESVDRNSICPGSWILPPVALRKESVDRNAGNNYFATLYDVSLSARRAWIEIGDSTPSISTWPGSLSARRAWIEIDWAKSLFRYLGSRSPQGERG